MAKKDNQYYVYVYIDPRNFEEFYYGKGIGSRKNAHLKDEGDTEKAKRIKDIQAAGLIPIIKVIAKGLTEQEAFLIEKTLIWKLGKNLTNIASGHFADKFRPHNTFHKELVGFDYENGLYYVNVGEGKTRCWVDCRQYGFLTAGQGRQWSDPLRTLVPGDVVVAYLKNRGYVGVGKVLHKAVPVNEFKVGNALLHNLKLTQPGIFKNCDNEKTEYLVKIDWIKTLDADDALWQSKSGLFTSQLVKASLQDQQATRNFLEAGFGLSFKELLL